MSLQLTNNKTLIPIRWGKDHIRNEWWGNTHICSFKVKGNKFTCSRSDGSVYISDSEEQAKLDAEKMYINIVENLFE